MPNPTTPDADVRVVYRYLNTAVIRFGKSQYNNRYVVQIFKNGVSQGAWHMEFCKCKCYKFGCDGKIRIKKLKFLKNSGILFLKGEIYHEKRN